MNNRAIKVSKTAQGTCLMRATSFYEQDPQYKSDDYLAALILPSLLSTMLKYPVLRTIVKKALFKAPGIYEYVIARTKLIDNVFHNTDEQIEQVLIFGAGFDSRAVRFKNQLKNAKVFELDAPATQQAKIDKLQEKNIEVPANVTFIALDFTKESLTEKLNAAGFQKNRRCLFLLEGLTYYLDHEAIDHTFTLISEYSLENSLLVFDYAAASAVRDSKMSEDKSIKNNYQALVKAGEKPGFMVEGEIRELLTTYKFDLIEEMNADQLANQYFNKDGFEPAAQIFRIVTAVKKD